MISRYEVQQPQRCIIANCFQNFSRRYCAFLCLLTEHHSFWSNKSFNQLLQRKSVKFWSKVQVPFLWCLVSKSWINHSCMISLLTKDGSFKDKYLWVKKSTGLGVTECMLRIMAWLCTVSETQVARNCQMCIVTGPNIDTAIKLITRLKNIFERKLG
jgi:hypothetical protein